MTHRRIFGARFGAAVVLSAGLLALIAALVVILSAGFHDVIAYIHLTSVYSDGGDVRLLDPRTGKTALVSGQQTGIDTRLMWSADGRLAWAAGHVHRAITLWDGKQVVRLSPQSVPEDETPVWSPDGRLVWAEMVSDPEGPQSARPVVKVYDGSAVQAIGLGRHPTWSDDGQLAWFTGADNRDTAVWDGQSMTVIEQGAVPHPSLLDEGPIWSADGRLAWVNNDADGMASLIVWDGAKVTAVDRRRGVARWPVWSADGRLAWYAEDSTDSRVYVWDGQTVTVLGFDGADDRYPTWAPDGRLAWESRPANGAWDIFVWDGQTTVQVTNKPGADLHMAWSNDNQLVWSSFHDGQYDLCTWDGQTSRTVLSNGALNWFPSWQHGPQIAWLRR